MPARKALWIPGSGGTPSYDAIDDRSMLGAILGGDIFDTAVAGAGMIGRGHGILSADALAVTSSGSSNSSVSVAAGMASVRGTNSGQLGCYLCANDAAVTLALTVRSASLARTDLIVAEVRDATYSGASNDWQLRAVTGTNGGGVPAVPASSLVLAQIAVPAGSNPWTVTAGNITDLRPHARAVGGILPIDDAANHPDPQDFDVVWESDTSQLLMRLDGVWQVIGRDLDTNWTSVTPNWGGTFVVGTGTQYCRYFQFGGNVTGVAGFERNTPTGPAGGTGDLFLDLAASGLPAVRSPGDTPGASHVAGGRAWDDTTEKFWSCTASVDPVSNRIQNFGTAGGAVWRQDTINTPFPAAWNTGDHLRIFFHYEADV